MTVRAKIDSEITRRVGKWFTVRELQEKLRVENSTLKPLIMRYARDSVLVRRKVKGVARAVQFSPAAKNTKEFQALLDKYMPYKAKGSKIMTVSSKISAKKTPAKTPAKNTEKKTENNTAKKSSSKKTTSKKNSPAKRK